MKDFYETTVQVRYVETDQMGVVYHSNFLVWFEIGRVEMLRQMGFVYKKMEEEDDTYIVVAEVHCRYRSPARYDDLLRIRTRIAEARSRALRFAYEVINEATGKLVATGETVHVICDRRGCPKQLPAKYRKDFHSTRSVRRPTGAHS